MANQTNVMHNQRDSIALQCNKTLWMSTMKVCNHDYIVSVKGSGPRKLIDHWSRFSYGIFFWFLLIFQILIQFVKIFNCCIKYTKLFIFHSYYTMFGFEPVSLEHESRALPLCYTIFLLKENTYTKNISWTKQSIHFTTHLIISCKYSDCKNTKINVRNFRMACSFCATSFKFISRISNDLKI